MFLDYRNAGPPRGDYRTDKATPTQDQLDRLDEDPNMAITTVPNSKVSGIKFPLQFHGGRIATSYGEQHIKESIIQIIATNKQEYLMIPNFGSDLSHRVFDPVNITALVRRDVSLAISTFETRVTLISVGVDVSNTELGRFDINISFQLAGMQGISSVTTSL
jgi:uncharacterized protein